MEATGTISNPHLTKQQKVTPNTPCVFHIVVDVVASCWLIVFFLIQTDKEMSMNKRRRGIFLPGAVVAKIKV